jgi:glycosyltransferase involved in cell wall biosynthesis
MQQIVDNLAISVVMTAYNAEKYISFAIQSIVNQSFENFEFLIIDDGSTDNTTNIIKDFATIDNRIIPIIEGKKGYYNARRELIEKAQGKYIAVIDADDIAFENRLAIQYDFMEKNQDIGFCGADCICIDADGKRHKTQFDFPKLDEEIKLSLLFFNCIIHPNAFIRKSVLVNNKLNYIDCAAEDWQLWTKLASVTKFHNIKEPLLQYRIHAQNMNQSVEIKNRYETEINVFLKTYLNNIFNTDFSAQEINGYFGFVYWDSKYENYDNLYAFLYKIKTLNNDANIFDNHIFKIVLYQRIQKKFTRFNQVQPNHYQHYKKLLALLAIKPSTKNDYLRELIVYITSKTKKRWLK